MRHRPEVQAERAIPMPDRPFNECPTCGTPQIDEAHTLVLYFKNPQDREDFAALVKSEMPNATAYPVGSVFDTEPEGAENGQD